MHDPANPNAAPPVPSPAWRDVLLAVVVGASCYAISCVLVAPASEVAGFGIDWQLMSTAPLDLLGRLPHRLLAPLLAYAFGCGGENYVLFARAFPVVLLTVVFLYGRRRGANVIDATLVTLAIALTAAVQMYKWHWVGYPDALCYALFFGNLLAARRPVIFWILFGLNLFNHELASFLLPWLWGVRREVGGSKTADLVGAGLALGVYGAFYLWVRASAPAQFFSADYFAAHPLFPAGTVVVWGLALTHLVVAFGPVLAVLAWHQHAPGQERERWHFWLVTGAIVAIFCIAFDWARHSNLIVLPLVIASLRYLAAGHRVAYVVLVATGVVGMLLVPPWTPRAWPSDAIYDPAMHTGVVQFVPDGSPLPVAFGPLRAALTGWLPAVWHLLAAIVAIAVAIWLAGWWLARRDRATEPGREPVAVS